MKRPVMFAAIVAAIMAQGCSRHTSESAQAEAAMRRTAVTHVRVDDSVRLARDCVLLIDSPTMRIVRRDSVSAQIVTFAGRRAVIASRTEALALLQREIAATDSVSVSAVRTETKTAPRSRWLRWLWVVVASAVAGLTLLLSSRGTGSRR